MPQYNTIVVCIDFSECSKSALKQAGRLARGEGASLHVVHAIDPSVVSDLADAVQSPRDELEAKIVDEVKRDLSRVVEEVGVKHPCHLHAPMGDTYEQIEHLVKTVDADLAVMGIYGSEGDGKGAGSVAIKCVRQLPKEVLLVHERHRDAFARIIACIDFSPTSGQAMRNALVIAAHESAELHALHVYNPPWHTMHFKSSTHGSSPAFQNQFTTRLRSRLETFVADETASVETKKKIEPKCEIFDYPSLGLGIIKYSRETEADLLVLGTLGHSKLRYFFLGSTAERVLRELSCSVLAVKPVKPAQE